MTKKQKIRIEITAAVLAIGITTAIAVGGGSDNKETATATTQRKTPTTTSQRPSTTTTSTTATPAIPAKLPARENDIDGDGVEDRMRASVIDNQWTVNVWMSTEGPQQFTAEAFLPQAWVDGMYDGPPLANTTDMDGDGKAEIALMFNGGNDPYVYIFHFYKLQDGKFVSVKWGPSGNSFYSGVISGDNKSSLHRISCIDDSPKYPGKEVAQLNYNVDQNPGDPFVLTKQFFRFDGNRLIQYREDQPTGTGDFSTVPDGFDGSNCGLDRPERD